MQPTRRKDTEATIQATEIEDDWERMEITVDSAAYKSVCPPSVAKAFEIQETESSRKGCNFVAANNIVMRSYGMKQIMALDEEWRGMRINFQVAEVTKPLLSVRKLKNALNMVVLKRGGGYIRNLDTGRHTRLYERYGETRFAVWMPSKPRRNVSNVEQQGDDEDEISPCWRQA